MSDRPPASERPGFVAYIHWTILGLGEAAILLPLWALIARMLLRLFGFGDVADLTRSWFGG